MEYSSLKPTRCPSALADSHRSRERRLRVKTLSLSLLIDDVAISPKPAAPQQLFPLLFRSVSTAKPDKFGTSQSTRYSGVEFQNFTLLRGYRAPFLSNSKLEQSFAADLPSLAVVVVRCTTFLPCKTLAAGICHEYRRLKQKDTPNIYVEICTLCNDPSSHYVPHPTECSHSLPLACLINKTSMNRSIDEVDSRVGIAIIIININLYW